MGSKATRTLRWTGNGVSKRFENRNNWTPRCKPRKGDRCVVETTDEWGSCPGPIDPGSQGGMLDSISILPGMTVYVV